MHAYGSVAAILLLLLAGSAPAMAQDASSSVSFDGIGLTFDEVLGTSVDITTVPGQPADLEQPSGPEVPHLAFTLYGPQPEATKVPRASLAPNVIRLYRTDDLTGYDQASQELATLEGLLSERPDLAPYEEVAPDGSGSALPYLPIVPAAQVIRARVQYIDTPELAGVAYLTAFRQDVSPFAADDFWYTFQGLSADGGWYVAADFVVQADGFPAKPGAQETRRISEASRYADYLEESVSRLNGAPADDFTPVLGSIDALVRSIEIADTATDE